MASLFIVEDNDLLRITYKKALTMYGHKIIGAAANGHEAIMMYKNFSNKPDVILLDYRMPIKNGIEVMKEILEIDKSAKCIFVSADIQIREEVLELGAVSFKEKPFSFERLYNNIEKALVLNN
jgi:two-component system chemotaxis response regulator CheY